MGWFRRKPTKPRAQYRARVLDISGLYCNVAITRAGKGFDIGLRITDGSRQERASLSTSTGQDRLTLAGGDPYTGRRIVHLATGGQSTTQIMRGNRIQGDGRGSIVVGQAGDVQLNRMTGDVHIGSAQNVRFGRGLTVYLTVGDSVRIVGG